MSKSIPNEFLAACFAYGIDLLFEGYVYEP